MYCGFSFVRTEVACAKLERTSGFELSSKTTAPMCKVCYAAQLLTFYLDLPSDAIGADYHQTGLPQPEIRLIPCANFVETFHWRL